MSGRDVEIETREDSDRLFYLGAGPLLAIVLGMALVPLRGFTPASNLTFVFLALTILVAELGGRKPAVATALASALSLDFFLTEPYLRLSMASKHDIIAFFGLAACGLIVAGLGSKRGARLAALRTTRMELGLLRSLLADLDAAAPLEPQLTRALQTCRSFLPLSALAVRDAEGRTVASSDPKEEPRPVPRSVLAPGTSVPESGGRIALLAGDRTMGWLDVWPRQEAGGFESGPTLTDLSRILALLLVRRSGT
jgi:two-component system sensor histidine kinase KdpD